LIPGVIPGQDLRNTKLDLARVLLVDEEIASRLTLQTILEAGGYSVDVAACAAEALDLLDTREYELVLSGARTDRVHTGRQLLNYARLKPYKPATAVVTSYHDGAEPVGCQQQVSIGAEDMSLLLGKVADLISTRATRRAERAVRQI
jgi:CheY-like chemotaxis protein